MNQSATQTIGTMLPGERRASVIVALVAAIRMFGLFALLPVLALYARELEHATPLLVGVAVGGYGLTQALLQIPFGLLSDRIGRLPVILGGLAVFATGSLIAAHSSDIYGVIAGRLLQGAGAVSATLSALLADATRESVRTRSMAFLGIGIGASFMLAFILGPAIAAVSGIRFLFYLAAVLAGVAALMLTLLPRDIAAPRPEKREPLRNAIRPDLLRLDLYIFILHAIFTASFVAMPFLLRNELGLPLERHWQLYLGAVVVSLAGTVPLVLADERKGKAVTVTIAILALAAGLFLLALFGNKVWTAFAALTLFFAGFNFLEAGLPARVSIRAAGDLRGASMGVFSSAQFLGIFAGGMAGGWLLGSNRPYPVFLAAGIVALAWLLWHRGLPSPD